MTLDQIERVKEVLGKDNKAAHMEACLRALDGRMLQSIIADEIDPDDCAVYYRADKHWQRLCTLGDVRNMAKLTALLFETLVAAKEIYEEKAAGT